MFLCAFSETEYHLSLRNLNYRFESCEAHQVFYAWLVKWYNRIENLRFVCSNCDSQLDTYKSKNKKKLGVVAESGLLQLT